MVKKFIDFYRRDMYEKMLVIIQSEKLSLHMWGICNRIENHEAGK